MVIGDAMPLDAASRQPDDHDHDQMPQQSMSGDTQLPVFSDAEQKCSDRSKEPDLAQRAVGCNTDRKNDQNGLVVISGRDVVDMNGRPVSSESRFEVRQGRSFTVAWRARR